MFIPLPSGKPGSESTLDPLQWLPGPVGPPTASRVTASPTPNQGDTKKKDVSFRF
jgi:hypothetical protein